MKTVYIVDNMPMPKNQLDLYNSLRIKAGKNIVMPMATVVPDDCDGKDIINGAFSPQAYETRIQKEREQRYKNRIEELIRRKYSVSDEIAILRQQHLKTKEYSDWDNYVEECKLQAKVEFGL